MCKNAEWVLLTIDDYIPCYPGRGPVFSRANGPELWVLLLEKAYAKAHGSYDSLKYGFTKHGMLDLTGFPTMYFEIPTLQKQQTAEGREILDQIWECLHEYDDQDFLISGETPGEDQMSDAGGGPSK